VKAGHDGTWVAHPGLVGLAKEIFDQHMPTPNQIFVKREEVLVTAADLLKVPEGDITEKGLRTNVDVGIQYLESWLRGSGCVPIYNLMEDAATAEISRTQVWQWAHYGRQLSDGRKITGAMIRDVIKEELNHIHEGVGEARYNAGKYPQAAALFEQMMVSPDCKDFLTLEAYRFLE
jgi:malate synthase